MQQVIHVRGRRKQLAAGYVERKCTGCDAVLEVPATDRQPATCRDCRIVARLNGGEPAALHAVMRRLSDQRLCNLIDVADRLGCEDVTRAACDEALHRIDMLRGYPTPELHSEIEDVERQREAAEAKDPERWDLCD